MMTWAFVAALRLLGFLFEPSLDAATIHAVAGEPARVEVTRPTDTMTVVTWNIERGVAFGAVADTLHRLQADVVLLQEVDRRCDRSNRRDVARDLAVHLHMNWVSAGEFQEVGEGARGAACVTGQAILSRWPITDPQAIRFESQSTAKWTWNPVQPRRGGRVALRATTGGIVAYSVHLESGDGSEALRTRQLREVGEDAERMGPRVVVAGDFNNASGLASDLLRLLPSAGLTHVSEAGGIEAQAARRPIDWVFARGLTGESRIVRTEDASDHDPVVARLRIR